MMRFATVSTRIIAAIAFLGGLAVSAFIVERIGQRSPPLVVALPVAFVVLIKTEFLFLRHRYGKV